MSDRRRLIVHVTIPGGADDALAACFFDASLPAFRRMRLSDPVHEPRRRWPEALGPLPDAIRLVAGRIPIGYFDTTRTCPVHVCVLGDPEAGFLRFAAALQRLSPEMVLRLTGVGPAALAGEPEVVLMRLLANPLIRRRQLGAMTRLCAGLPRLLPDAGAPDEAAQLRAARANLARTNVLAGLDLRLDDFADYLARTLGWPPAPSSPAAALEPVSAMGLRPTARDALRAAVDLDLRLYEGALDTLDMLVA